MQADYPAQFVREMGCTPAELCAWLPGASRGAAIAWSSSNAADTGAESPPGASALITFAPAAQLHLQWTVLAPRRIALVTLPRLEVRFNFGTTDPKLRHHFMKHFDLYTQRGGG